MTITFEEMLKIADFHYTIGKNEENEPCVFLIDEQGAYLGGKDSYEFPINDSVIGVVARIIDRLDNYWEDYIYNDIVEILEADDYEVPEDYGEVLYFCKNHMHSVSNWELEALACVIDSSRLEISNLITEIKYAEMTNEGKNAFVQCIELTRDMSYEVSPEDEKLYNLILDREREFQFKSYTIKMDEDKPYLPLDSLNNVDLFRLAAELRVILGLEISEDQKAALGAVNPFYNSKILINRGSGENFTLVELFRDETQEILNYIEKKGI